MAKADKTIKFNLSDSADVSQYLKLMLEGSGYDWQRVIQYCFLTEEALIRWRSEFPADAPVEILRRESKSTVMLDLCFSGKKADPFVIDVAAVKDKAPIEVMHDRIQSGVGVELKFRYRQGQNHLILKLPKKNPDEKIYKWNLMMLMIPLILQSLLNTVAEYADAFMLGFLDADSMSAVSLATSFSSIHTMVVTAICTTLTALVSQYWGKRDRDSINRSVGLGLKIGLGLSMIFVLAALLAPYQVMSFYTDVESIRTLGASYLRIMSPTFLISAIYLIAYGILGIEGKGKVALRLGMAGCITNMIANTLLIFGLMGLPQMGIQGAAIATVLSDLVQIAGLLIYNKKNKVIGVNLGRGEAGGTGSETGANAGTGTGQNTPDGLFASIRNNQDLRSFGKLFVPTVSQVMSWTVASNILTRAFGHLGADVIAANSVLVIISGFVCSATTGIYTASGIIVGGLLGKNKLEEAYKKANISLRIGAVCGVVGAIVFLIVGYLMRFMPMDLSAETISYMNIMLIAYSVNICFAFMNGVMVHGTLEIGGDNRAALIIDTVCMWCIYVPVALLGTDVLGFPIIFMAIFLKTDEILSFPAKLIRFRQGKWVRNLTK